MTDRLFPVADLPEAEPQASYTRRLTIRRRATLAAGRHPATGLGLLRLTDPPQRAMRCGDCSQATKVSGGGQAFWKCQRAGITHGPATDIRISWPACAAFERSDPSARGIQRTRYQETTTT